MSKRNAYPIEFLLKLKQVNPEREFEGEDLKAWNEFLEEQAENNLMEQLKQQEYKPAKKTRKVKQTVNRVDTESFENFDEIEKNLNETDEASSED
ncbi:MAG: hypothetical protein IJ122_06425 [Methanobrevibacter sp.]|nr:hypothetical protein [Methanobrevibacter sp.]